MVCKKCGKEFTSDNNICPFCNNDNNLNDNAATETSQPVVEEKKEEVESLLEPVTPAKEELKPAEPEVEVLLEPAPATTEQPEVEVLLEPAKQVSEQTPTPEVETLVEQKNEPATLPTTEVVAEPIVEKPAVATTTENTIESTPTTANTTELTTETSTNTDDDEESEEKKKIEPRVIIMMIIIVVLGVIALCMYWPKNDGETNAGTNTNTNNNTNNTPTQDDFYEDDLGVTKNWSGIYKNDNFEVEIIEFDGITADITITGITAEGTNFTYNNYFVDFTEEMLYKKDKSIESEYELTITKTVDGIQVFAVSSDPTSNINQISGIYTKVN